MVRRVETTGVGIESVVSQAVQANQRPEDFRPQQAAPSSIIPATQEFSTQETSIIPERELPDNFLSVEASNRLAHLAASTDARRNGLLYDQIYAEKLRNIEEGNEQLNRQDGYQRRVQSQTEQLQRLVDTGQTNEEILAASAALLQQTQQEDREYALEKEAVDTLTSFADANPAWADLRLHHRPVLEQIQVDNRKEAVIKSILDRKRAEADARGGFAEFLDDALEITGSILTLGGTDLFNRLQARDWNGSGQILRERANRIRQLPEDEIPAAMDELYLELAAAHTFIQEDEEDALADLQLAFGTDQAVREADVGTIFEAVMFGVGAGELGSIVRTMKRTGNVERVADDAIRSMKNEGGEANIYPAQDEAVRDAVYFKVDQEESDQIASHVQRNLEINEQALADAQTLANFDRLSPEELQQAATRRINQLKRTYRRAPIQQGNVRYNTDTGVYEFDVLVGRANGAAFASQKSARAYLTKNNLDGEVVEQGSGFFVKQTQTIAEQFADKGLSNVRPINLLKRVLQSPRSFVDEVLGRMGTASAYNEARITGVVRDIYNRNIRSLPNAQFKEVTEILNQGLIDETWYDPSTLTAKFRDRFGKEMTDAQMQAYFSARQIEDFGHFVQNRALYQEKVAKGLQTVDLKFTNVGEFNGNVLVEPDDWLNVARDARIYDAGTNTHVRGTPDVLERLQQQGYIMIRPEDASWTAEAFGEGASFIATKANKSVVVRDLDFNQLNYLPGGRRRYTDTFFVGQTRSGVYADGTRYQLAPRTFRSSATRLEAEEWADKYNAANQILRDSIDGKIADDEADELILDLVGRTRQEYEDFVEVEGWDLNTELKVRGDREDFTPDFDAREAVRLYDPEAIESGFGTTRNGRLSARGTERLKNVNEEDAETLDFISAMNTSADQAIKMGAYNDFKISSINRFNTQFRQYFDDADRLTPYEIATKGKVSEALRKDNPGLYNAIKGHQFYINSILRNRGEWDERVQEAIDQLAFFIEKRGETGKRIATKIHQSGGNPIERLRGLNYDLNLGMFNPAQLLMQANSMLTALALSPRHGLKAFSDTPIMRYMLIANDEDFSRELAKRTVGNSGSESTEELIKATNQFRRLGLNDFGTNLAMMDMQNTLGATSNRFVSRANRIREAGRFFFQEGERYGRLTAFNIARRNYRERFPDADLYSKDADNWIRNEADRLLLSPNSDNNQLFTKGVTSLPTQFWSYMGKMSDAILTGSGGRYSRQERIQLVGSQALFYGAGGIPLIDYFANQYQSRTGDVLDPETQKFISNGLIDGMIFVASDGQMNTDFSSYSGIGSFWLQMFENLWENPISTVAFGATGANLSGGYRAMADTARMYSLWHNPTPEAVTATALAGVGSVVKSLSRTTQAYLAYNTGIWYDRHGRAVTDVTKAEAIGSVFGLNPQNVQDAYSILTNNREARTKYVNEVATTLQALHEKWYRAETEAEKKEIEDLINTFSTISQNTGYFPEVARRVQSLKKQANLNDAQTRILLDRYLRDQEDANMNYLPLDARRQILEEMR